MASDSTDWEAYKAIKRRAAAQLRQLPGVHAVGLGSKVVNGEPSGQVSIRVMVGRKLSPEEVAPGQMIPAEFEGLKTDVVEVGVPRSLQLPGADPENPRNDVGRYRPLIGGSQIMRQDLKDIGTLGCFLQLQDDPDTVLALTNHHVLYGNCSGQPGQHKVGQPTTEESCFACCQDMFGTVLDAICNIDVDAALIKLNPGQQWLAEVMDLGPVAGHHEITDEEGNAHTFQVRKRGRTTARTGGVISDIDVEGESFNEDKSTHRLYQGALMITTNPDPERPFGDAVFAKGGDSGSVLLDTQNRVVGLLFSSSGVSSWAIPIQQVFQAFSDENRPPERQFQLQVATAEAEDDVRTVPGAAAVAVERQAVPALAPEGQTTPAPVEREAARTADAPPSRLEEDIRSTPLGDWYADLYLKHLAEINRLIQNNRRMATAWRRSGGAALFQSLLRVFNMPQKRMPERIGDRPVRECIKQAGQALMRYGSLGLRQDLTRLLPTLPDIAGLTYRQIIEKMRSSNLDLPAET